MKPITKKQHKVLTFIDLHITTSGYAPTIREIADALGKCPATIHEQVTELVKRKRLKRHHRCSRALIIVKQDRKLSKKEQSITVGEAIEHDCAGEK